MDYKSLPRESLDDSSLHASEEEDGLAPTVKSFLRRRGNIILFIVQLLLIIAYIIFIFARNTTAPTKSAAQFGRNLDYMSLDHKFDHLWGERAVEEAGVIILKEHGGPYTDIEHGAISMFHQLHCLRAIRMALQDGYEGRLKAMDWRLSRHWPHCLWYLRQAILCNADGYIEHETEWNGTSGFIDGADDVRRCADLAPLYALFDEKGVH